MYNPTNIFKCLCSLASSYTAVTKQIVYIPELDFFILDPPTARMDDRSINLTVSKLGGDLGDFGVVLEASIGNSFMPTANGKPVTRA